LPQKREYGLQPHLIDETVEKKRKPKMLDVTQNTMTNESIYRKKTSECL